MGMKINGENIKFRGVTTRLREFCADERGATAIEYGLIVALLSVAVIATITTLSGNMKTVYTTITNALK